MTTIRNSFTDGEVQILEFILQTLMRGGTPTMATRHRDFASLYRKTLTMKKRLGERRIESPARMPLDAPPAEPRVKTTCKECAGLGHLPGRVLPYPCEPCGGTGEVWT